MLLLLSMAWGGQHKVLQQLMKGYLKAAEVLLCYSPAVQPCCPERRGLWIGSRFLPGCRGGSRGTCHWDNVCMPVFSWQLAIFDYDDCHLLDGTCCCCCCCTQGLIQQIRSKGFLGLKCGWGCKGMAWMLSLPIY